MDNIHSLTPTLSAEIEQAQRDLQRVAEKKRQQHLTKEEEARAIEIAFASGLSSKNIGEALNLSGPQMVRWKNFFDAENNRVWVQSGIAMTPLAVYRISRLSHAAKMDIQRRVNLAITHPRFLAKPVSWSVIQSYIDDVKAHLQSQIENGSQYQLPTVMQLRTSPTTAPINLVKKKLRRTVAVSGSLKAVLEILNQYAEHIKDLSEMPCSIKLDSRMIEHMANLIADQYVEPRDAPTTVQEAITKIDHSNSSLNANGMIGSVNCQTSAPNWMLTSCYQFSDQHFFGKLNNMYVSMLEKFMEYKPWQANPPLGWHSATSVKPLLTNRKRDEEEWVSVNMLLPVEINDKVEAMVTSINTQGISSRKLTKRTFLHTALYWWIMYFYESQ